MPHSRRDAGEEVGLTQARKLREQRLAMRDASIIRMLRDGLPTTEIAKALHCHKDTVRKVKAELLTGQRRGA